ncbi:MAG: glutathione S-transferase family protein [Hyphomicrobium zavarzinii]|jgi:glutathione S-transferase|uniref:glutathione S-transferase family protein n=1 Tax=Hyphomicrobium TaxID=81 RepID=UPI000364521B|nr:MULTISPECIES: glutathione S-transferase family protein [Hyphomicrobium]MBL8845641.1 glutathione S-transferase family protein [Hyphomicrobium zavarzinii]WBT38875.1 glutathione S-transferase family protein [Hyphomicrobium sp. DMF-1]
MHTLTHFRLCPKSRSIRIALAEIGVEAELAEERPWEWRPAFLALNPAGELPVLALEGGFVLCGAYAVSEYFADLLHNLEKEGRPAPLFQGSNEDRAEQRRLVDWFHGKLDREVTRELLYERVYGHLIPDKGHAPDPGALRAIRANIRYHLGYVNHLAHERRWLAGDEMSFADMAAAAHLSSIDYLGEVAWEDYPSAKSWYARMKSRPSFRALLADRMPGISPAPVYADLDF